MRLILGLIAGVILGFLLGGVEPRRALSGKDAEISALKEQLAEALKKGKGRSGFLPLPDLSVVQEARQARDEGWEPDADPEGEGASVELGDGPPPGPPPAPPTREEQIKSFDVAVDAQRLRARQSRAALQEQAELSPEELAEFDDIVSQMNEELAIYGEDVLAWTEEEPETRDALGVAHEVTGILYESQSALEELVGADALSDVDEPSRQIWNYIDLETFRPAVEAQLNADPGLGGAGGSGGGR